MLNEIRSLCWKIATQELSEGEEWGIGFCCVGLRGPPTLWYTHWSSASSRTSYCRQHTSTSWEDFVSICVQGVQKGLISHFGDSLTKNDIRLVGVQQFKSLCADDAPDFCSIHLLSVRYVGRISSKWRDERTRLPLSHSLNLFGPWRHRATHCCHLHFLFNHVEGRLTQVDDATVHCPDKADFNLLGSFAATAAVFALTDKPKSILIWFVILCTYWGHIVHLLSPIFHRGFSPSSKHTDFSIKSSYMELKDGSDGNLLALSTKVLHTGIEPAKIVVWFNDRIVNWTVCIYKWFFAPFNLSHIHLLMWKPSDNTISVKWWL